MSTLDAGRDTHMTNDHHQTRDEMKRRLAELEQQVAEAKAAPAISDEESERIMLDMRLDAAGVELPELNLAKVHQVIASARAGLSPQDYGERIAWCIEHGVAGAVMYPRAGEVEFKWGGRTLAVVPIDVLTDDKPLPPGEFIHDVPDTIAELDDGDEDA